MVLLKAHDLATVPAFTTLIQYLNAASVNLHVNELPFNKGPAGLGRELESYPSTSTKNIGFNYIFNNPVASPFTRKGLVGSGYSGMDRSVAPGRSVIGS